MAIATTTEKNSLATKYGADALYAALFTADPGTTGTAGNEVSGGSPAYARKLITWGAAANGVITGSVTFDVPNGVTLNFAGVCSAASGDNLLDRVAIASQQFSSQGTYALTLTFTAS